MPTRYTPPSGADVALVHRRQLDRTHPVRLAFGADDAPVLADAAGTLVAALPGLVSVTAVGAYDNAVSRSLRPAVGSSWAQGTAARPEVAAPWRRSVQRRADPAPARWVPGQPLRAEVAAPWVQLTRLRPHEAAAWRLGQPVELQSDLPWQRMTQRRPDTVTAWTLGTPQAQQLASSWQAMTQRRRDARTAWQPGESQRRAWAAVHHAGQRQARSAVMPWGRGHRPGAGPAASATVTPVTPVRVRCYTPPRGDQVEIALAERWYGPSAVLRFRCRLVDLPATYTIPYSRIYMAVHSVAAVRLPDLLPITLDDATISTDSDGYGWSLSATGPADLLTLLAGTAAEPAQIRITVDGRSWVFVIDKVGRSRQFGQARAQVKGLSLTALLGAPWSEVQTWTSTTARTAVQLLEDCVAGTDYQIDASEVTDWQVPAGAWSFRGTPLAAVQRIAESIGAVLTTDPVAPVLRLLPRYPVMPWEWSSATVSPDVRLPLASVESDGWERRDAPAWTRAIVSGEAQGVTGIITRAGTGGLLTAPPVTDALATAKAAVLQRGQAILGAGGRQALITQTLPVLSGAGLPGVLQLGQLVETVEPGETWRGIVRSVSLKVGFPSVRQTVALERHLQEA